MIGAVVQARMASRRVPGKVLAPLAGRPVLGHVLERLERASQLDRIVVATSDQRDDDILASFCAEAGVPCHRGPLEDVARRVLDAADSHGFTVLVRVCGDSPLIDHRLVDRTVREFRLARVDVVTNVHPRTYPVGQSVEAIATDVLRRAVAEMRAPEDREHVTPYIYRHDERFAVRNLTWDREVGGLRLAVDTPEDLAALEALIASVDRPGWDPTVEDLAALARRIGGPRPSA